MFTCIVSGFTGGEIENQQKINKYTDLRGTEINPSLLSCFLSAHFQS